MNIEQSILEIMKHITVLNDDYTKMSVDVAILKSQMAEIMWYFKAVIVAFIGVIVTQFWHIVILRKNGKK